MHDLERTEAGSEQNERVMGCNGLQSAQSPPQHVTPGSPGLVQSGTNEKWDPEKKSIRNVNSHNRSQAIWERTWRVTWLTDQLTFRCVENEADFSTFGANELHISGHRGD